MDSRGAKPHLKPDEVWFILRDGKQYGPYSFAVLADASAKGIVAPDTTVRRGDWTEWLPASHVITASVPTRGEMSATPAGATATPAEPPRNDIARNDIARNDIAAGGTVGPPPSADPAPERLTPPMRLSRFAVAYAEDTADERAADTDAEIVNLPDFRELRELSASRATQEAGETPLAAAATVELADIAPPDPIAQHHPRDGGPELPDAELSQDHAAFNWAVDPDPEEASQPAPPESDAPMMVHPPRIDPMRDRIPDLVPDRVWVPVRDPPRAPYRNVARDVGHRAKGRSGRPARRFGKRLAAGLAAAFVVVAAGWGLYASGVISPPWLGARDRARIADGATAPGTSRTMPVGASAGTNDLPAVIVDLPVVVTLQHTDPAAFAAFKKRFAAGAVNAPEDELLSLARAALRKSLRRQLANAPGDMLLDITDASLGYMEALQSANPETCVALSDESKGARSTGNLAKDFPIQFIRDMSVLEHVASVPPSATIAPPTEEQARPYLDNVFAKLGQQQVKTDLLYRDKLDPSEFAPYCALVTAFYRAVLAQPRDDAVTLLRYLYALAAADTDGDRPQ